MTSITECGTSPCIQDGDQFLEPIKHPIADWPHPKERRGRLIRNDMISIDIHEVPNSSGCINDDYFSVHQPRKLTRSEPISICIRNEQIEYDSELFHFSTPCVDDVRNLTDEAPVNKSNGPKPLAVASSIAKTRIALDHHVGLVFDNQMAFALAQEEASEEFKSSIEGKAWEFVRAVIAVHGKMGLSSIDTTVDPPLQVHDSLEASSSLVELIGTDDMIFMVERLIVTQMYFAANQKDCNVDIGFHFTKRANLDNIREHGLLTKADRDQHRVSSIYNGSQYGDGVYTGSNPFAYRQYGSVGIMVARLCGESHTIVGRHHYRRQDPFEERPDTVIVHPSSFREMVVLSRSSQGIPLTMFRTSLLDHPIHCQAIWNAQLAFQSIIDRFFNDGTATTVRPW